MAFKFPWSNLHEMNLDWIIEKVKNIPTKTSQLINDSGFITDVQPGTVFSVNGKTGVVTLDANDVGALPDTYTAPVLTVNGFTGNVMLDYTNVGALPSTFRELYWCTYGTTTNAEIEAAIAADKLPVILYSDNVYVLGHRASATNHYFYLIYSTGTTITVYYARCNANTWTSGSNQVAKTASPTFTGTPAAPTATTGTNTTQLATTAFVQQEIAANAWSLSTEQISVDNVTINANTDTAQIISASIAGKTPVGIAGWFVDQASDSGQGRSWVFPYQLYLRGTDVYFLVRNFSTAAAKVKLTAIVLYTTP